MNKNPIGVLDSGVGGLSILKEIIKKLPDESFIYLADSKNCPYGSKSSEEIYKLSARLVRYLLKKKVKLIVIACNTITVACLDKLRKDFPQVPIIGTVPVVKTASEMSKNGRIGILSTNQTAESRYQKNLINKFAKNLKVLNLGTDKLVPIIEIHAGGAEVASEIFVRYQRERLGLDDLKGFKRKWLLQKFESSPRQILEKELKPFVDFGIDVLVLGCSHFLFLKREMQKVIGNKIKILDSGGAIARQTKRVLLMESLPSEYNSPKRSLLTTGKVVSFKRVLKKDFLDKFNNIKKVKI